MNPNCTCDRGICEVHRYPLRGKILERYKHDQKYADMIDNSKIDLSRVSPKIAKEFLTNDTFAAMLNRQAMKYDKTNRTPRNKQKEWLDNSPPSNIHIPYNPSDMPAPPEIGLGDQVSYALSLVGITEERVSNWLGHPCGCKERREKLNKFGSWLARMLSGSDTEEGKVEIQQMMEKSE